jgi:uncharacterized protein YndB with AHSA1/START domain
MSAATMKQPASHDAEITLVLRRSLKAKPERVFAALTDKAQVLRWFGPAGFTCAIDQFDARPGGEYRIAFRSQDAAIHTVTGTFLVIEPPSRLAYTWGWLTEGVRGHETRVEIELTPAADGTDLVLTHRGFESVDARNRHEQGWSGGLANLQRLVEEG